MCNLIANQARKRHLSIVKFTAFINNIFPNYHASKLAEGCTAPGAIAHHQRQQQYTSASTGSQQGTPLKTALRQLYKRVHPDLFTDFPAEQAENERSFKLLQDYLHQARHPSTGPAARTAYNFSFYLLPQHNSDIPNACISPSSPSSQSSFHHVQLSLAPPEPRRSSPASSSPASSSSGGQHLSAAAAKALKRLLQLCGYADVVVDEAGQQDTNSKLTTFIPEAAEYVRQHESGAARHEVRVANIRAAVRLAWRVVAGFQPDMFTGEQQVELLQRLTQALDLLSKDEYDVDLSGLQILISDQTALSSQGTLCLAATESAEDWADFLGGVDLEFARGKKSSAAAVRQFEGQVAAAVGVRMIFTAAAYLMTSDYRQFLERLTVHAAEHGPVQSGSSSRSSSSSVTASTTSDRPFLNVPLYVAPPHQQQPGGDQQQPHWVVHESLGYIRVDMSDSAQQVYSIVQAHGLAAASILAQKQQQQQELAELSASVRSQLGIRHLYRDELVSEGEFKSACKRLLYHRDLLLRCNVEGMSVRISDKNKIASDGSVVDIAWNFDM